ncbi:MAG: hypothetical protein IKI58_10535 [Oscillospiraceae bacterium]|nr:hypothetical protein [Oscillospiraceae bacterium]
MTVEISRSKFTKNGTNYIAKYDVLAVKDFRSVISATIYDGDTAISDTLNYSVETYAYNRLEKSESETFKELLREMMKYGISGAAYFS